MVMLHQSAAPSLCSKLSGRTCSLAALSFQRRTLAAPRSFCAVLMRSVTLPPSGWAPPGWRYCASRESWTILLLSMALSIAAGRAALVAVGAAATVVGEDVGAVATVVGVGAVVAVGA